MTQDEKKKIISKVDEVLKQRKGDAPVDRPQPFLEGDVVTFSVPKSGDVSELILHHPERVEKSGYIRKEYFAVKTDDGREISQRQLVGNRGNGLDIEGDSPDERLKNFIAEIVNHNTISLKVEKVRILPSVRSEWNGQRIYTWGEAA